MFQHDRTVLVLPVLMHG